MGSKMRRITLAALGIFWAAGITRRYSTIMDEDTFALPTISLLRRHGAGAAVASILKWDQRFLARRGECPASRSYLARPIF
jgi:hypothetical protein